MVQSQILNNFDIINHSFYDREESKSDQVQKIINDSIECEQIHSNKIELVEEKKFYKATDSLISKKKSSIIIRTADCMPILFFEKNKKIIGALHVGRKGLITGIIQNLIKLLKLLNTNPRQLFLAIGPHICKSCYEIDLSEMAIKQFFDFGIPNSNMEIIRICTYSNHKFNSYRRDRTPQRNYSVIKLLN